MLADRQRRLGLAHGRARQVARRLLHQRQEGGLDGQVGPVAIDRRGPQEHAPLAVARLDQRRRAVGEAQEHLTLPLGRRAEQRVTGEARRLERLGRVLLDERRQQRVVAIDAAEPLAGAGRLALAVVAIVGGGADGAQRLQRLRQQAPERGVVGVGIDVVAERDEEAAAVAHVVRERGAVGRLDVAQKDDVEVGEPAVGDLVGRDGGDVELRVVAIARAQRRLQVEDLVVAVRGARIAVDDEHAQIAAHLDAREAAIVGGQRIGRQLGGELVHADLARRSADGEKHVEEALLRGAVRRHVDEPLGHRLAVDAQGHGQVLDRRRAPKLATSIETRTPRGPRCGAGSVLRPTMARLATGLPSVTSMGTSSGPRPAAHGGSPEKPCAARSDNK